VWDEHKQEEFDLWALLFVTINVGLLLVTFQDRQIRDKRYAHTVYKTLKVYI
jgi:hypothetical protein